MDFYFTDRKFNLLGIASAGGQGDIQVIEDTDHQLAETAAGRTYTGTLVFSDAEREQVTTMAELGNYILYKDPRGKSLFMTIMEWSNFDPQNNELEFIAENGGVDLINEMVPEYKAPKAMTIKQYLEYFVQTVVDSGFEVGSNEIPTLTRTLNWESESETALARIESVAKQFDAELDFRFEITGTKVVKRYIDVYKRIGADKNQRLEVNTHVNKIVTTSNIYDLYTAVTPIGGTPESKEGETKESHPVTLKNYKWTDPSGRYVLNEAGTLLDTVANRKWSRYVADGSTKDTVGYISRVITYTAVTQATLLQSALAGLKKAVEPVVNYEVDIADLPLSVEIGDTVHLVDEAAGLNLSARLLELKESYANGTHVATLGDFLIEDSQVDPALKELADKINQIPKTAQYYPWIRYADDDQGNGMSSLPAGKGYMAVVYGKTSVPSDNAADYAGKWSKIVGPKGDTGTGIPGAPGKDGKSQYTHIAYANDVSGQSGFSTTDATGRSYFGQYVDDKPNDSTDPHDYTWMLVKGDKGDKGATGEKGKDGAENVPVLTSGASFPAKPKEGDKHWMTDASGVVTGYFVYQSGSWSPLQVSASALNASTFNGFEFNGVTFNGSKFMASGHDENSNYQQTIDEYGYLVRYDYNAHGTNYRVLTRIDKQGEYKSERYKINEDDGIMQIESEVQLNSAFLYLNQGTSRSNTSGGRLTAENLSTIDNVGLELWSGAVYPAASDVIIPSISLSNCLNGWLIVWNRYGDGNGPVDLTGGYFVTPVWKITAGKNGYAPGKAMTLMMATSDGRQVMKYIYAYEDKIVGNDVSKQGFNDRFVATKVYAF